MSDTRRMNAPGWLRLVGLCPLAMVGLGWVEALLLGGVLAITLFIVDTGLLALRNWSTGNQRPVIAALLAAVATGMSDLLLQTFCDTHAQVLQPFLPLPIVVAVLFGRTDTTPRWSDTSIDVLMRGTAFTVALLTGAALHIFLPPAAGIVVSLVVAGLLLAIVERFAPRAAASEASTSTPRLRARVTGPLR
jgi:Na+-translocating ferredoxin:NAD+ oxidoreductase RnfE subunit